MDLTSVKGSELTWLWCRGRKLLVFSVGIEVNSVGVSRHRNRLDIRVGIEIDLVSVVESNLLCFSYSGSTLTWFHCWDRN